MIELKGADELIKKLERLQKLDAVISVMRAAALYLKGKLAKYPAQRRELRRDSVYGSAFFTQKQQRFFFAALAKGTIDVPYKRGTSGASERFGQSWTTADRDGGMTQVIGNDTSYGPFVMGSYVNGEQSEFMHQMGWTPYDEIVDFYAPEVETQVVAALNKELE